MLKKTYSAHWLMCNCRFIQRYLCIYPCIYFFIFFWLLWVLRCSTTFRFLVVFNINSIFHCVKNFTFFFFFFPLSVLVAVYLYICVCFFLLGTLPLCCGEAVYWQAGGDQWYSSALSHVNLGSALRPARDHTELGRLSTGQISFYPQKDTWEKKYSKICLIFLVMVFKW